MRTPLRGLLTLLLFSGLSSSAYALDLGNGQDEECDWNGISIDARLWQCETLKITGTVSVPTGSGMLDIRVRQWAEIDGTLILNASASGPAAGYGGFDGGTANSGADGSDGQGPSGSNGQGGEASGSGFASCSGAGGSGGRYSGLNPPLDGNDTQALSAGCSPSPALGGPAPTSNYGELSNLENQMSGGSGGGAGGGANDGPTPISGGYGGGGGGAIRILAGGPVDIMTGTDIQVNGGNGEDGTASGSDGNSGAGGGGSGGTIYIATLDEIIISGTPSLSALGGLGGNGDVGAASTDPGGDGSDGDAGIIRLEDGDGFIPGASSIASPSGSLSTGVSATQSQILLESDISPGCAIRSALPSNFINLGVLFGLGLLSIVLIKFTRSLKVDDSSL